MRKRQTFPHFKDNENSKFKGQFMSVKIRLRIYIVSRLELVDFIKAAFGNWPRTLCSGIMPHFQIMTLQVSLRVASVPLGFPCHSSCPSLSQRMQVGAGQWSQFGEVWRLPGEPEPEFPSRTHIQETCQTQETARDSQAGPGTEQLITNTNI